jgi:hypothetical protein
MSKNRILPMSKENLASHMAGFPIIKSPLRTVWMTRLSRTLNSHSTKA